MDLIRLFLFGAAVGIVGIVGIGWGIYLVRRRKPTTNAAAPVSEKNADVVTPLGFAAQAEERAETVFVHADLETILTPAQIKAWDGLTPRMKEVAVRAASGKSAPEVAKELSIQPSTVRGYLKEIYAELDVHTRVELANFVREITVQK
jgi:DNA-binding CsgD family transcriptional regulator